MKTSLNSLCDKPILRMFTPASFSVTHTFEVNIYSDASEKVLSAFKYLHTISKQSDVNVVTLKEAPSTGHTIPRLELCDAVLAT